MMSKKYKTIHITLILPAELHKRTQHFVDNSIFPGRNALIVTALEKYLVELERQEIDQQFEGMADDETYQAMNTQSSEVFAESDWDAMIDRLDI